MAGIITFVKDRLGHDRRYAIDPSILETTLGWRPEIPFDQGLADTVGWYLENRRWWERVISGEYLEYYRVQYGGRLSE